MLAKSKITLCPYQSNDCLCLQNKHSLKYWNVLKQKFNNIINKLIKNEYVKKLL
jgi:hypothetical protein